ncbi:ArsR/SmtB family transcription factor [Methermicoccus shengliensis]|uniref:Winged helix-turn-helix transcriptional regulator n=1 Tax=Methermicoccus shengliensis TaxID=660064 RepID=A0A832RTA1_9EURY|nr:winged helix-turn-helix domain-containing protein [Methermicoccus shengliensis]KUK04996.1 MAG: hypothetical protein XD46_0342 [Euryarchaeota archaeon 55_53]KUK30041.1 MAG: hypothetical protein XD62_0882 [Methanosarcinales archeaon 56_1174]MDI3488231.1 hypothetical protein [Methanosarcinales archaeon]MDN5295021.1 hypothetical protein [Methanosarcinales archaeon]HIH70033.1 winged helix-turn-helix transcriptional regulator [Methermicoccus shengliensis]
MESDPVLQELEELKRDVGNLNDTLVRIRYEDFKRVVCTQIQLVLAEHTRMLFDTKMGEWSSSSVCTLRDRCEKEMKRAVDEATHAYLMDDVNGALQVLDGIKSLLSANDAPCADPMCSKLATLLIHDVRMLIQLSEAICSKLEGTHTSEPLKHTPEEISSILSPLSHPIRIGILRLLERQSSSFSDISRALGLKSGHLQFHLGILRDAGYIRKSGRGVYAITQRGTTALQGAERLMESLR